MKFPFFTLTVVGLCAVTTAAQFDPEQCGPSGGNQVCKQSKCCSQYGWCGQTAAYCEVKQGCNRAFGRCTGTGSPAASPSPKSNQNQRCGSSFGGLSCQGSVYGSCCSQYGWCGTTTDHCKAGCQAAFGTCLGITTTAKSSSRSSSTASRSSSVPQTSRSSTRVLSASSSQISSSISRSSSAAQSSSSSYVLRSSSSISSHTSSSVRTSSQSSAAALSSTSASSSRSVTSTTSSVTSSVSSPTTLSSSTSSTVESSSSTVSSRTSSIDLFGSASTASSSSAASASQASLSSSLISTSSISASGTSSSVIPTPSTPNDSRTWRFARNPNVDRTSRDRFVPSNTLELYYVEQSPGTLSKLDTVTLTNDAKGIILDDISTIGTVSCSGSRISITFTNTESINWARNWPVGTLLFTSATGCIPAGATELSAYAVNGPATKRSLERKQSLNELILQLEVILKSLPSILADIISKIQQLVNTASSTAPAATSVASVISSIVSSESSAVQTPSATPLPPASNPSSFCLRVITPGVTSTGWLVTQGIISDNGNFRLNPSTGDVSSPVARFYIGEQNVLAVNTPGFMPNLLTGYSRGTGGMFRFNPNYAGFNPTKCTIETNVVNYVGQQVLKCTGGLLKTPVRTFTGFRHYNKISEGITNLFGTDDFVTNEDGNFVIELGAFTGGDCPADTPVAEPSSSTSDSSSAALTSISASAIVTPDAASSSAVSTSAVVASDAVSSSVSASAAVTPDVVSTSSSASAVPTPASDSVYTNFCLRVLTQGKPTTGWVIKQSNPAESNGAMFIDPEVGGLYGAVSRFSIDPQTSILNVNTPGSQGVLITRYSRGTSNMFRWSAPLDSPNFPSNTCVVKTDVDGFVGQPILKCSGGFVTRPIRTFTAFADGDPTGNGGHRLFGMEATADPDSLLELGLFTGGVCPE